MTRPHPYTHITRSAAHKADERRRMLLLVNALYRHAASRRDRARASDTLADFKLHMKRFEDLSGRAYEIRKLHNITQSELDAARRTAS